MKAPGSLFFPVTLVCLIASNMQAEEPAKDYQAVEKLIISGKYEKAVEALAGGNDTATPEYTLK